LIDSTFIGFIILESQVSSRLSVGVNTDADLSEEHQDDSTSTRELLARGETFLCLPSKDWKAMT